MTISRKTEKAFKIWLQETLGIDSLNYYAGHEKADAVELPHLVIYAENSEPHPEFPADCGVRIVSLRCKLTVDSDATTRDELDEWKDAIVLAMTDDREALQTALNKPSSGTDTREVKNIHFHYVSMSEEPSAVIETDWVEDMVFNVTAEPLDA